MEQNDLDFTVNLADVEAGGNTPDKEPKNQPLAQAKLNPLLTGNQQSGYTANKPKSTSACSILTVDYWSQYFDVSQEEIIEKTKACLNPTTNKFQELITNKVDLYGPFWISTTLIFCMIIMPRFVQALLFSAINFDVSKVGFGFTLVYGGLGIFTLIYYAMSKAIGLECELFRTAAIYGYSYTVFIVAALATILSMSFLHFIFAIAAGIHSVLFLLRNFKPAIDKLEQQNKMVVIAFFGIYQLIMTLMIYSNYLS